MNIHKSRRWVYGNLYWVYASTMVTKLHNKIILKVDNNNNKNQNNNKNKPQKTLKFLEGFIKNKQNQMNSPHTSWTKVQEKWII